MTTGAEGFDEVDVAVEGPVLFGGAAAGVDGDGVAFDAEGVEAGGGGGEEGGGEVEGGGEAGFVEGERHQGLEEEVDGVAALDDGGAGKDLFGPGHVEVAADLAFGVVEVVEDEVEGLDGRFLPGGEVGDGNEEADHFGAVEGDDFFGKAGGDGEVGDVGVAPDFDFGVGPAGEKGLQDGEGDDEVADGATAEDQYVGGVGGGVRHGVANGQ